MTPRAGIIWDLDHTLYESNDDILHSWLRALGRTCVRRGYFADDAAAFDGLYASFLKYGHALTQLSQDYEINERDLISGTFPAGKANFESIRFIEKCDRTFNAIDLHRHLPQAILTSALREWADQVVKHLDLHYHFPATHIIALEDAGYQSKALSRHPFDLASVALGLPLDVLMMVEDNANNLKMAKDLGLVTVLVTHGIPPHAQASHVDFVVNKAYDVFGLISSEQIKWQK